MVCGKLTFVSYRALPCDAVYVHSYEKKLSKNSHAQTVYLEALDSLEMLKPIYKAAQRHVLIPHLHIHSRENTVSQILFSFLYYCHYQYYNCNNHHHHRLDIHLISSQSSLPFSLLPCPNSASPFQCQCCVARPFSYHILCCMRVTQCASVRPSSSSVNSLV